MMIRRKMLGLLFLVLLTTSCSYNPFIADNHLTGSPAGAIIGAGVGGGGAALFDASKPMIALSALTGGMIGYYATTLRADAAGIINAGGEVYQVGDYVGIYLRSDCLFQSNTDELLPQAEATLNSVVTVLKRYPYQNILISGNTSGFYCSRYEQLLSEKRAQRVAAFLWKSGINNFEEGGAKWRKLNFVGYGDWFPLSSNDHMNNSYRMNSRIQITVYPSTADLGISGKAKAFNNVGSIEAG